MCERCVRGSRSTSVGPSTGTCGPACTTTPVSGLSAMQQAVGNAVFAQLARAGVPSGSTGPRLARTEDEEFKKERTKRDDFVKGGAKGPQDMVSASDLGGFSAGYEPGGGKGTLAIVLRGAVDFKDGIVPGRLWGFNAVDSSSQAKDAADNIAKLPKEKRGAALKAWQWDAESKTKFLAGFKKSIEDTWGKQLQSLHCSRKWWEDVEAKITVKVEVHEGAQADGDHMTVEARKVPDGMTTDSEAYVAPTNINPWDHDADENKMVVSSNQIDERRDFLVNEMVVFDGTKPDDSTVAQDLSRLALQFKDAPTCRGCGAKITTAEEVPVNISVRGSGPDAAAQADNAGKRFQAIVKALESSGMQNVGNRAVYEFGGPGNWADLAIGSGMRQKVVAHEAGHMFGMRDEYVTGKGSSAESGEEVDQKLREKTGVPAKVGENNDSIMSVGGKVKAAHHAPFIEALQKLSSVQEWAVGPGKAVNPPAGAAPAPAPAPAAVP